MMMEFFVQNSWTGHDLVSLNWCRIRLEMLFLSDIITANGRLVDTKLL